MLKVKFGPFPVLKTERLLLRQMLDTDANRLFAMRSDPRVMAYFGKPLMPSVAAALKLVKQNQTMFTKHKGVLWAMSFPGKPEIIGTITIWRIDKVNHRGEIGYLLAPEQQGKGLMSEALQAVLNYGFNTLGLHAMEANVNPDNAASIQLLERNGFVREAYFRENFYFDGKFEDSAIYSLLNR